MFDLALYEVPFKAKVNESEWCLLNVCKWQRTVGNVFHVFHKAENPLEAALLQEGVMVAVGKSWRLLRMGEGTKLPIMLPAAAVPREETSTEFRVGWVQGYLAFW